MRTNLNDINITLRSRADYYNRIQPDLNNVCNQSSIFSSIICRLFSAGYEQCCSREFVFKIATDFSCNRFQSCESITVINQNEIFIFIIHLQRLASNSSLYQAKHNPQGHRTYQQTGPLGLPDQNEHLIELPSDIFLTSRTGD
jgi:hypothetical protein